MCVAAGTAVAFAEDVENSDVGVGAVVGVIVSNVSEEIEECTEELVVIVPAELLPNAVLDTGVEDTEDGI